MRLEEENKVEQTQSAEENKPMSALDAINASFAAQRTKMGTEKGKAKPASAKKDKKPAGGKKKNSGNEDLKWNLITGLLVLVIIVVAAVIVVTLYQSSRAQGQAGTQQTEGVGQTEDTAQGSQNTENENETSENAQAQTDHDAESDQNQETEGTGDEETGDTDQTEAQTQGVVPEEYTSILTEEEQKEWKEKQKDSSRVFIQLNQKVEITDMENVYLRLINPPYSVFTIQVKVYPEDAPENILYESDRVAPGTVLEYVPFSGTLDGGSHPAKVEYTVYDEDGNELGTHVVDITLEVNAE